MLTAHFFALASSFVDYWDYEFHFGMHLFAYISKPVVRIGTKQLTKKT